MADALTVTSTAEAQAAFDSVRRWVVDDIPMSACGFDAQQVLDSLDRTCERLDLLKRNHPEVA